VTKVCRCRRGALLALGSPRRAGRRPSCHVAELHDGWCQCRFVPPADASTTCGLEVFPHAEPWPTLPFSLIAGRGDAGDGGPSQENLMFVSAGAREAVLFGHAPPVFEGRPSVKAVATHLHDGGRWLLNAVDYHIALPTGALVMIPRSAARVLHADVAATWRPVAVVVAHLQVSVLGRRARLFERSRSSFLSLARWNSGS